MNVEYYVYIILNEKNLERNAGRKLEGPIPFLDNSLPARGDILVNFTNSPDVWGPTREYFEVVSVERVYSENCIPFDRTKPIRIIEVPHVIVRQLENWPEYTTLEDFCLRRDVIRREWKVRSPESQKPQIENKSP